MCSQHTLSSAKMKEIGVNTIKKKLKKTKQNKTKKKKKKKKTYTNKKGLCMDTAGISEQVLSRKVRKLLVGPLRNKD